MSCCLSVAPNSAPLVRSVGRSGTCQCRCRWPRSCMRQLYGGARARAWSQALWRRQFGSRSHGQAAKETLSKRLSGRGGRLGLVVIGYRSGSGHSWGRSSPPLIDSGPIDRQHHATAHSLQLRLPVWQWHCPGGVSGAWKPFHIVLELAWLIRIRNQDYKGLNLWKNIRIRSLSISNKWFISISFYISSLIPPKRPSLVRPWSVIFVQPVPLLLLSLTNRAK